MTSKPATRFAALFLLGAAVQSIAPAAFAQDPQNTSALNGLDILTVTGTQRHAKDVAGSVTFIGPEELAEQNYADILRVITTAPGVNIQEEDGYGLRPNIGIRGSGSDRSSKIAILEDGVLIAPAPYAAPSAYYFPSTGRMNALELTKGPATIKYGPNTTAGALHLFSTPIPDATSAHLDLSVSDLGTRRAHGWAGGVLSTNKVDFSGLVETYQDKADGFKTLKGGETGYDIEDYVLKLKAASKDGGQSLELKFQTSDQVSDETYLGLSQEDFDEDPYQRYKASADDRFVADHQIYQLTHNIALGDNAHLTTTAYRTDFERNWRKLHTIKGASGCNSLDAVLRDSTTCAAEIDILKGKSGLTSADDALQIRANNRRYFTKGIQTALNLQGETGAFDHNLTASLRYHEDGVDRFQDQDGYKIDNGSLVLTTDNAPGSQANRLSDAKAISGYIEDQIQTGDLSVTAGLRIEDVKTQQKRWSTPDRSAAPSDVRANKYTEWLPALSFKYDATEQLSLLAGVHKGFSAPSVSATQDTSPERSIVWEGGARWESDKSAIEAIGFFNDYSNLVGACTASSGSSDCDIGDQFNAGAVDVYGLELTASHGFEAAGFTFPLSLAYTWTESEFKTSFTNELFGGVERGDELAYVPNHQLSFKAGMHADSWGIDGVMSAQSETRNAAGSGNVDKAEEIEARAVVDMSAYYDLREGVRVKLKVENLFDNDYVASRRPSGLRPGKPREIFASLALDF